ncbi:unnamed protein product [Sphagnum jensenii]|uniref:Protein kinase domain-containing protein n=1 Tax=Sphagnum jensenii TaxID=128206 RepID=A0ABP0WNB7_9BRYO
MATKFLLLARATIDSVKELTSGDSNQQQEQQRLKLNKLQCKFVAEKLAAQTEDILNALELMFAGGDSAAAGSLEQRYEEALKEVYRVVTDALSLIKDSCGEKWLLVAIRQRAGNNLEDFAKVLYEIEWCTSILCSIYVPRNTSTSSGRQTVIFEPEGCNGKLSAFDLFKLERSSNQDRESLRSDLEHLRQGHVCDSSREVCLRLQNDECIAAQLLEKLDKWPANSLTDDPVSTVENLAAAVPSLWKVDPRNLKKGKKLGKGGFGKVYETEWLTEKYAKKIFRSVENESFKRESDILARFCHPNAVRTVCWSEDKEADNFSLVMDLMTEDLYKFLHRVPTPALSIPAAVNLMLQVAEALKYLHGKGPRGLVHRDLKSLNILVRPLADAPELKYEGGYLNPKVADFGEAKIKTLISNFERKFTTQTQNVGTSRWMAPEVFKIGQDADIDHESASEHPHFNPSKADVYSFAIVCFELLTREEPYKGVTMASLPTQITKHGLRPQLPESCPTRLAFLIQSCWKSEPGERPNFREICRELRYIKGLLLRGDEVQLQKVDPHPFSMELVQIQGPWETTKTARGYAFFDRTTGGITGLKLRFSPTHKAVWRLTVDYDIPGQLPAQFVHGSMSDPRAVETKVTFDYPSEYLEQIQGSYGVTPALIYYEGDYMVNMSSDTTVGPNNHHTVIASLTFKTNIRTYGPFGATGDTTFKTDVGKILGFFGRSGACVDSIGVFVARHAVVHS